MNLFITFPSAYEFWMHQSAKQGKPILLPSTEIISDKDHLLFAANSLSLKPPLHVAIPKSKRHIRTPELYSHVMPKKLPIGSIVQIAAEVYVSSPELCYLQAAQNLPLASIVEIANNLCGAYYIDKTTKFNQKKRIPLTNIENIATYLKNAAGLYGVEKARNALRFATNNSYSPYESRIAANSVLPMHFGGYHNHKAELNYKIDLTPDAKQILRQDECICDFVWPEFRLVLEYDSNKSHLEIKQHYKDKNRQNAITLSGYQLISATSQDFDNFRNAEKLFLLVRKSLGLRIHQDRLEKTIDERWQVFQQLFRNNNMNSFLE